MPGQLLKECLTVMPNVFVFLLESRNRMPIETELLASRYLLINSILVFGVCRSSTDYNLIFHSFWAVTLLERELHIYEKLILDIYNKAFLILKCGY